VSDGQTTHTVTAATKRAYAQRHAQLWQEAQRSLGIRILTPSAYAKFLVSAKRIGLEPPSWRVYRSAARFGMTQMVKQDPALAEEVATAIAFLDRHPASPPPAGGSPKTSHAKEKGLRDLEKICLRALSGQSPNRRSLVQFLRASTLAGLRPCEWPSAQLKNLGGQPYQWELRVTNAKATNGRGNGETRTLRWHMLPPSEVSALQATISAAKEHAAAGNYLKWVATLRSLIRRITRELFSRRKTFPTLYSARHAAAARWKAFYIGSARSDEELERAAAIVAALLGHGSDLTASSHYGRTTSRDGKQLIPDADEEEVLRVRKRLLPQRHKLDLVKALNDPRVSLKIGP
jgi:hypothetical protein